MGFADSDSDGSSDESDESNESSVIPSRASAPTAAAKKNHLHTKSFLDNSDSESVSSDSDDSSFAHKRSVTSRNSGGYESATTDPSRCASQSGHSDMGDESSSNSKDDVENGSFSSNRNEEEDKSATSDSVGSAGESSEEISESSMEDGSFRSQYHVEDFVTDHAENIDIISMDVSSNNLSGHNSRRHDDDMYQSSASKDSGERDDDGNVEDFDTSAWESSDGGSAQSADESMQDSDVSKSGSSAAENYVKDDGSSFENESVASESDGAGSFRNSVGSSSRQGGFDSQDEESDFSTHSKEEQQSYIAEGFLTHSREEQQSRISDEAPGSGSFAGSDASSAGYAFQNVGVLSDDSSSDSLNGLEDEQQKQLAYISDEGSERDSNMSHSRDVSAEFFSDELSSDSLRWESHHVLSNPSGSITGRSNGSSANNVLQQGGSGHVSGERGRENFEVDNVVDFTAYSRARLPETSERSATQNAVLPAVSETQQMLMVIKDEMDSWELLKKHGSSSSAYEIEEAMDHQLEPGLAQPREQCNVKESNKQDFGRLDLQNEDSSSEDSISSSESDSECGLPPPPPPLPSPLPEFQKETQAQNEAEVNEEEFVEIVEDDAEASEDYIEVQEVESEEMHEESVSGSDQSSEYTDQVIDRWQGMKDDEPEDIEAAISALAAILYKNEEWDIETTLRRTKPIDLYRYLKQVYFYKIHTDPLIAAEAKSAIQNEALENVDEIINAHLPGLVANAQQVRQLNPVEDQGSPKSRISKLISSVWETGESRQDEVGIEKTDEPLIECSETAEKHHQEPAPDIKSSGDSHTDSSSLAPPPPPLPIKPSQPPFFSNKFLPSSSLSKTDLASHSKDSLASTRAIPVEDGNVYGTDDGNLKGENDHFPNDEQSAFCRASLSFQAGFDVNGGGQTELSHGISADSKSKMLPQKDDGNKESRSDALLLMAPNLHDKKEEEEDFGLVEDKDFNDSPSSETDSEDGLSLSPPPLPSPLPQLQKEKETQNEAEEVEEKFEEIVEQDDEASEDYIGDKKEEVGCFDLVEAKGSIESLLSDNDSGDRQSSALPLPLPQPQTATEAQNEAEQIEEIVGEDDKASKGCIDNKREEANSFDLVEEKDFIGASSSESDSECGLPPPPPPLPSPLPQFQKGTQSQNEAEVIEDEFVEIVEDDDDEASEDYIEVQEMESEEMHEESVPGSDQSSEYADQVIDRWQGMKDDEPEDIEAAISALAAILYKNEEWDIETTLRRTKLIDLYRYLKQVYFYKIHTDPLIAAEAKSAIQNEALENVDEIINAHLPGLIANAQQVKQLNPVEDQGSPKSRISKLISSVWETGESRQDEVGIEKTDESLIECSESVLAEKHHQEPAPDISESSGDSHTDSNSLAPPAPPAPTPPPPPPMLTPEPLVPPSLAASPQGMNETMTMVEAREKTSDMKEENGSESVALDEYSALGTTEEKCDSCLFDAETNSEEDVFAAKVLDLMDCDPGKTTDTDGEGGPSALYGDSQGHDDHTYNQRERDTQFQKGGDVIKNSAVNYGLGDTNQPVTASLGPFAADVEGSNNKTFRKGATSGPGEVMQTSFTSDPADRAVASGFRSIVQFFEGAAQPHSSDLVAHRNVAKECDTSSVKHELERERDDSTGSKKTADHVVKQSLSLVPVSMSAGMNVVSAATGNKEDLRGTADHFTTSAHNSLRPINTLQDVANTSHGVALKPGSDQAKIDDVRSVNTSNVDYPEHRQPEVDEFSREATDEQVLGLSKGCTVLERHSIYKGTDLSSVNSSDKDTADEQADFIVQKVALPTLDTDELSRCEYLESFKHLGGNGEEADMPEDGEKKPSGILTPSDDKSTFRETLIYNSIVKEDSTSSNIDQLNGNASGGFTSTDGPKTESTETSSHQDVEGLGSTGLGISGDIDPTVVATASGHTTSFTVLKHITTDDDQIGEQTPASDAVDLSANITDNSTSTALARYGAQAASCTAVQNSLTSHSDKSPTTEGDTGNVILTAGDVAVDDGIVQRMSDIQRRQGPALGTTSNGIMLHFPASEEYVLVSQSDPGSGSAGRGAGEMNSDAVPGVGATGELDPSVAVSSKSDGLEAIISSPSARNYDYVFDDEDTLTGAVRKSSVPAFNDVFAANAYPDVDVEEISYNRTSKEKELSSAHTSVLDSDSESESGSSASSSEKTVSGKTSSLRPNTAFEFSQDTVEQRRAVEHIDPGDPVRKPLAHMSAISSEISRDTQDPLGNQVIDIIDIDRSRINVSHDFGVDASENQFGENPTQKHSSDITVLSQSDFSHPSSFEIGHKGSREEYEGKDSSTKMMQDGDLALTIAKEQKSAPKNYNRDSCDVIAEQEEIMEGTVQDSSHLPYELVKEKEDAPEDDSRSLIESVEITKQLVQDKYPPPEAHDQEQENVPKNYSVGKTNPSTDAAVITNELSQDKDPPPRILHKKQGDAAQSGGHHDERNRTESEVDTTAMLQDQSFNTAVRHKGYENASKVVSEDDTSKKIGADEASYEANTSQHSADSTDVSVSERVFDPIDGSFKNLAVEPVVHRDFSEIADVTQTNYCPVSCFIVSSDSSERHTDEDATQKDFVSEKDLGHGQTKLSEEGYIAISDIFGASSHSISDDVLGANQKVANMMRSSSLERESGASEVENALSFQRADNDNMDETAQPMADEQIEKIYRRDVKDSELVASESLEAKTKTKPVAGEVEHFGSVNQVDLTERLNGKQSSSERISKDVSAPDAHRVQDEVNHKRDNTKVVPEGATLSEAQAKVVAVSNDALRRGLSDSLASAETTREEQQSFADRRGTQITTRSLKGFDLISEPASPLHFEGEEVEYECSDLVATEEGAKNLLTGEQTEGVEYEDPERRSVDSSDSKENENLAEACLLSNMEDIHHDAMLLRSENILGNPSGLESEASSGLVLESASEFHNNAVVPDMPVLISEEHKISQDVENNSSISAPDEVSNFSKDSERKGLRYPVTSAGHTGDNNAGGLPIKNDNKGPCAAAEKVETHESKSEKISCGTNTSPQERKQEYKEAVISIPDAPQNISSDIPESGCRAAEQDVNKAKMDLDKPDLENSIGRICGREPKFDATDDDVPPLAAKTTDCPEQLKPEILQFNTKAGIDYSNGATAAKEEAPAVGSSHNLSNHRIYIKESEPHLLAHEAKYAGGEIASAELLEDSMSSSPSNSKHDVVSDFNKTSNYEEMFVEDGSFNEGFGTEEKDEEKLNIHVPDEKSNRPSINGASIAIGTPNLPDLHHTDILNVSLGTKLGDRGLPDHFTHVKSENAINSDESIILEGETLGQTEVEATVKGRTERYETGRLKQEAPPPYKGKQAAKAVGEGPLKEEAEQEAEQETLMIKTHPIEENQAAKSIKGGPAKEEEEQETHTTKVSKAVGGGPAKEVEEHEKPMMETHLVEEWEAAIAIERGSVKQEEEQETLMMESHAVKAAKAVDGGSAKDEEDERPLMETQLFEERQAAKTIEGGPVKQEEEREKQMERHPIEEKQASKAVDGGTSKKGEDHQRPLIERHLIDEKQAAAAGDGGAQKEHREYEKLTMQSAERGKLEQEFAAVAKEKAAIALERAKLEKKLLEHDELLAREKEAIKATQKARLEQETAALAREKAAVAAEKAGLEKQWIELGESIANEKSALEAAEKAEYEEAAAELEREKASLAAERIRIEKKCREKEEVLAREREAVRAAKQVILERTAAELAREKAAVAAEKAQLEKQWIELEESIANKKRALEAAEKAKYEGAAAELEREKASLAAERIRIEKKCREKEEVLARELEAVRAAKQVRLERAAAELAREKTALAVERANLEKRQLEQEQLLAREQEAIEAAQKIKTEREAAELAREKESMATEKAQLQRACLEIEGSLAMRKEAVETAEQEKLEQETALAKEKAIAAEERARLEKERLALETALIEQENQGTEAERTRLEVLAIEAAEKERLEVLRRGNLSTCLDGFERGKRPVFFKLEMPSLIFDDTIEQLQQVAGMLKRDNNVKRVSLVMPAFASDGITRNEDIAMIFEAVGSLRTLEELRIESCMDHENRENVLPCIPSTLITSTLRNIASRFEQEDENSLEVLSIKNMILVDNQLDLAEFTDALCTIHEIPTLKSARVDVEFATIRETGTQ